MDLKEIQNKLASQSAEIAELKKAMMDTTASPTSMQIEYTDELKSLVFENAPYFRFLESKGRVQNIKTTYAGFYVETDNSASSFIDEGDDIPAATASKYTEKTEKMKTIIHPIDISMMAQMGNQHMDLLKREIEKGFIKVTNLTDDTLLQGTGSAKDFKGFVNQVTTNTDDLDEEPITEDAIDDMLTQIIDGKGGNPDCIVTTNNASPRYVTVRESAPVSDKNTEILEYFQDKFGVKLTDFDSFLSAIQGRGYSGYYNSQYPTKKTIDRMKNKQPINCTDSSQVGYVIALALGYDVQFVHVKCSSGTGHVRLRLKHPKNTEGEWIYRDPAAVLNGNGIRSNWCTSNYTLLAYDPAWVMTDIY